MKLLIKNARVINPANNIDKVLDILVEAGRISKLGEDLKANAEKIIDAPGKIVIPGIVDMHAHLREPGREDKETVLSATKAALKGGITSVLAMPNTEPTIDSKESIALLQDIIKNTAATGVFICASITKGGKGEELTDIATFKKYGAIAISDDGSSVDDEKLFLQALKIAREKKILLISHCEDRILSNGGVVNLGFTSTRLGLRGISKESEYRRVERDIKLAQKTKSRLHIAHVSCKESVEIIARAKHKGASLTCETAPHYFSLTEEAALDYDTNMKMNPPLRTKEDVKAIKEGLQDGTIDAIASDHAPHTINEKEIEFDRAAFGVIGLETTLAVGVTELVNTGILDWPGLIKKMCFNPARILGIDKGILAPGKDADITIISADKEWLVRKEEIVSKSKNSCFLGRKLKGVVEYTICKGEIGYPFSA
jgi:dihydroorotase